MAGREPQRVPVGRGAYDRTYGRMPEIVLFNRFFEENPTDEDGTALLTRPATRSLVAAGQGPIRKLFWIPGVFNDDLFIISGDTLFRWDGTTRTTISGDILGDGEPEIAVSVGPGYEHLFIADGTLLHLYRGTSRATATLTLVPDTPPDITTQTLQIGTTYYRWTDSLTGTPDGSEGDPFQVIVGSDDEESLANMRAALNDSGERGVTYSSTIGNPNTQVEATESSDTTLSIQARARGSAGNAIATGVDGAHLSWGGVTMSGGGSENLNGVEVPDLYAAKALTALGGFVVVVCADSQRWYFIRPGEIVIDPLDFYTAAEESDNLVTARQIGDAVAFMGETTIEFWYLTGDVTENGDAWLPIDGQAYSLGVVPGTALKIKDFVMFVGTDNRVYKLVGRPEPVAPNHGIFERIRRARALERESV